MVGAEPLSPAAVMVLLDPNASTGREALKVTLLQLLMQGRLRLEEEVRKGFLGWTSKVACLRPQPGPPPSSPEAASLAALAGSVQAGGGEVKALVEAARKQYGSDLEGFRRDQVLPGLVRRGLVEARRERWLGLFPVTRYRHTPAGAAEKARIESLMAQARTIPGLLAAHPAQALGIAAALGSVILLLPELRPLYQELSRLVQDPLAASGYGDLDLSGLGWLGSAGVVDADLQASDAFDALDASLDAFDSAFDSASDSGGDGGGDGGGGGD